MVSGWGDVGALPRVEAGRSVNGVRETLWGVRVVLWGVRRELSAESRRTLTMEMAGVWGEPPKEPPRRLARVEAELVSGEGLASLLGAGVSVKYDVICVN